MLPQSVLKRIGSLRFDGWVRVGVRRGKGPRRKFILDLLRRHNLKPWEDEFGNVYVEVGNSGRPLLFSAHMDVEHALLGDTLIRQKNSDLVGIIDDAVGCFLLLSLAMSHKRMSRVLYVFTASEEEQRDGSYGRSASEVLRVLRRKEIRPVLCVAVDATYPRLLVHPDILAQAWDGATADQLFDAGDNAQVYLDGFGDLRSARVAQSISRSFGTPRVRVRDLVGWDEADIYRRVAPAFACGPVVFGKLDMVGQRMPRSNLSMAYRFLAFVRDEGHRFLHPSFKLPQ
ncbi:M28 family peptidase [Candidatus Woesearchaeota archaeon]|nr:M28 family peptidase [Candidatus Woesearchaeota archaeon]